MPCHLKSVEGARVYMSKDSKKTIRHRVASPNYSAYMRRNGVAGTVSAPEMPAENARFSLLANDSDSDVCVTTRSFGNLRGAYSSPLHTVDVTE